jgi:hypothetical protein
MRKSLACSGVSADGLEIGCKADEKKSLYFSSADHPRKAFSKLWPKAQRRERTFAEESAGSITPRPLGCSWVPSASP